jgi:hypothetical protein
MLKSPFVFVFYKVMQLSNGFSGFNLQIVEQGVHARRFTSNIAQGDSN